MTEIYQMDISPATIVTFKWKVNYEITWQDRRGYRSTFPALHLHQKDWIHRFFNSSHHETVENQLLADKAKSYLCQNLNQTEIKLWDQ